MHVHGNSGSLGRPRRQAWPPPLAAVRAAMLTLCGALCSAAGARTVHVPLDHVTIQAGLDAAASGDTVLVGAGTYTGLGNRDLDFAGKDLVLQGAGGAAATIIDCQGNPGSPARGVHLHSGETQAAVVDGFTIRSGYATDHGGGILCEAASPRIVGCVLTDNATGFSGDGAGITCLNSAAILSGCRLVANVASVGAGGGMLCSNSTVVISDCSFVANHATWGGGLYCDAASAVDLLRCAFTANEATFDGGLSCDGSSGASLRSCTFAFNAAADPTRATGVGLTQNSTASLETTLIAFGPSGVAVYCDPGSSAVLRCCDLFLNAGGDWVGCVATQLGVDGNLAVDPYFCDPASDDLRLRNDSPCLPGQHPAGAECGLIGAFGLGPCVSAVHRTSWSEIKLLFR